MDAYGDEVDANEDDVNGSAEAVDGSWLHGLGTEFQSAKQATGKPSCTPTRPMRTQLQAELFKQLLTTLWGSWRRRNVMAKAA